MKIARFSHQDTLRYGILDEDDLVVLAGDPLFAGFDTTGERIPLAEATLLAPVIPRSKVVGVDDLGEEDPILFLKPNTAVIGSEDVIVRPRQAETTDLVPTLAVMVGRLAKNVTAEAAADHILGYAIGLDVTARDLYEADGIPDRAKGFDTFAPVGPVIETEGLANAVVTLRRNGEDVAEADLEDVLDAAPEIVAAASAVFTLLPGDILLLPVDVDPLVFTAGDRIEASVSGIGTLRVAARDA